MDIKNTCYRILALLILWSNATLFAQINSDEFAHAILRNFGQRNGQLDSASANPLVNVVNPKPVSIKYKRNEYSRYDNIKIYPERKLIDISPYASYESNSPKLSMKVFTSAPKGTLVEIQLGNKSNDNYPNGIHSQYQAFTKTQNSWEELIFNFAVIPEGSNVSSEEINKIIIVFSPNSSNSDVYYFDDLKGPPMIESQ